MCHVLAICAVMYVAGFLAPWLAVAPPHHPSQADSEPALRMLAESRHQLVMITGDAALTACHVAAQVHIVDRPVLILTHLYVIGVVVVVVQRALCD